MEGNFYQRRKGFKSNKIFKNNYCIFSKDNYQGTDFKGKTKQNNAEPKGKGMPNNYFKINEQKELVKCWEYQGPHYVKPCPNRRRN